MTDLEQLRDDLVQDLHAHDCRERGQDPWPLSCAPTREAEYRARVDALMPRISTALAATSNTPPPEPPPRRACGEYVPSENEGVSDE